MEDFSETGKSYLTLQWETLTMRKQEDSYNGKELPRESERITTVFADRIK